MISIHKEPIIVSETVEMLYKFANGISFETVKSDFIRRYSSHKGEAWKQTVYEKTTILSKIMLEACFDLDQKNPTLQYYFGGYTSASLSSKCCLAQIMTWLLGAYDADFDTHMLNLRKAWRSKIENRDPIMLAPGMSFQYAKDIPFPIDFVEQIDSLQYPEEFRWRLFKLVSNPEIYLDELTDFIRPIAERLSVQLERSLIRMGAVYECWRKYFEEHSCADFALTFCHVDTEFPEDQDMHVYVNFMNATSVLSEMEINQTPSWYVHIGCLLDADVSYSSKNLMIDEICDTLRVLSDKSKFLILKTINDSPAYGTELADRMGLTNATISRHMNTLYNAGFITAEKENAKVYYRTNKEHLMKFLSSLCDELLK